MTSTRQLSERPRPRKQLVTNISQNLGRAETGTRQGPAAKYQLARSNCGAISNFGREGQELNKLATIGGIISVGGLALWAYGYYSTGHPPLISWQTYSPWWISDFLPNLNSEHGMSLMILGYDLNNWPSERL